MANKNDKVEITDADIAENDFSQDQLDDDSTDWKTVALEKQGIAKRRATQLGKAREVISAFEGEIKTLKDMIPPKETKVEVPKSSQSDELDFGQLAFHNTKTGVMKIEHTDDIDYLRNTLKETGKTQEQLLNANWFNAELKDRQTTRVKSDATPSGNAARGSTGVSNIENIDYLVANFERTGAFPPGVSREAKEKVADVLVAKERGTNAPFGDSSPIVGSSQDDGK